MQIGSVSFKVHAHVVQNAPFRLLLGRPFQQLLLCRLEDKPNGRVEISITDPSDRSKRITVPSRDRLAHAGSARALTYQLILPPVPAPKRPPADSDSAPMPAAAPVPAPVQALERPPADSANAQVPAPVPVPERPPEDSDSAPMPAAAPVSAPVPAPKRPPADPTIVPTPVPVPAPSPAPAPSIPASSLRRSTNGAYRPAELDGAISKLSSAAFRLVPYHSRSRTSIPVTRVIDRDKLKKIYLDEVLEDALPDPQE
jgi:hypothetical protein